MNTADQPQIIPLWPNGAPGSESWTQQEQETLAPIYSSPYEDISVPGDAPPLFIAVAHDDAFAASASVPLYLAWSAAGWSAELHIYSKGGHGFGMHRQGLPSDYWIDRFGEWLQVQGVLDP